MNCEKCQKNVATVHLTQIINGEKTERHLCDKCADPSSFDDAISFQKFFQGLIDMSVGFSKSYEQVNEKNTPMCKTCGLTFEGFRKTSKLGCADCYQAFRPQLDKILKNIHGSNHNIGKFPQRSGAKLLAKRDLENLKKQLRISIEKEEYEEAAKYRDKIKALEGDMNE